MRMREKNLNMEPALFDCVSQSKYCSAPNKDLRYPFRASSKSELPQTTHQCHERQCHERFAIFGLRRKTCAVPIRSSNAYRIAQTAFDPDAAWSQRGWSLSLKVP